MTCGNPADPPPGSPSLRGVHLVGCGRSSSHATALKWAIAKHPQTLPICTESQSLLQAIECRSSLTYHLKSLFNTRSGSTTLLWVPGHKGIPSLESTSHPPRPISHASAISLIRRTPIDPPPANTQTAEVYGGFSWSKDCMATSNRADAVLLARLRAGHTQLLKAYANLLDLSVLVLGDIVIILVVHAYFLVFNPSFWRRGHKACSNSNGRSPAYF